MKAHNQTEPPRRDETQRRDAPPSRKLWWGLAALLIAAVGGFAWMRVGMLDLPSVSSAVTPEAAGLSDLEKMKQLDNLIFGMRQSSGAFADVSNTGDSQKRQRTGALQDAGAKSTASSQANPHELSKAALLVQQGIAAQRSGDAKAGLDKMRQGIRLEPNNLVLANAYRMVVFGLRRDFLASARRASIAAPHFPPELDRQPIVFFEELDRQHPSRETKLHLAMAWVDEMLLFPALEIKAPSSVQAVDLLSSVIDRGNSLYVPALYARGLNHLHRPARLVWPESIKAPRDAAVHDIAKCVAIGRRLRAGSPRLQATLAMSLGDSYVKTGRLNVARSWWQIAQNVCHDADLQAAIRRRYQWQNEEILDRLEEELDRGRSELDHPMTDLALMWN